jgi:hypothetical protein
MDTETYIRTDSTNPLSPSQIAAKKEICQIVKELCNPDPNLRGNPKTRNGNQFDLQKYISIFDRLMRQAKVGLV